MMKQCTRCKLEFEANLSNFCKESRLASGLRGECKNCTSLRNKATRENYPEKVKEHKRMDRLRNGDKIRERNREYAKSERGREVAKIWSELNREHKRERRRLYDVKRRKLDPSYKILTNQRNYMIKALKGGFKSKKTYELLGCSGLELKKHLESKFSDGMCWDNYGEWHIDHIKPIKAFDKSNVLEIQNCFHYTNLQPLWKLDNLRKSSKF